MTYRCTTVITQEGKWFNARCVELGVVSQGRTVESAEKNLKEAVGLYLEDAPKAWKRLSRRMPIVTAFELSHG